MNEDLFDEGHDSDGEVRPLFDAVSECEDVEDWHTPQLDEITPTNPNNNPALQHVIDEVKNDCEWIEKILGWNETPKHW